MIFRAQRLLRILLVGGVFCVTGSSVAADVSVYTPVRAAGGQLGPNQFAVFDPANIPGHVQEVEPAFHAQFTYSGRDWQAYAEPTKPGRRPADPNRYTRTVLQHRTVPAFLAISFEQVETVADADPITLAKIMRFNREAQAKFRVLSEVTSNYGGVEGAQAEYVQFRKQRLFRVRHWITHFNGVVCQLSLIVPYEHPELLELGGANGFPVQLRFTDQTRHRPLLKDADIPRTFASAYGYRVDLGEGEWIPGSNDPFIEMAEYVAYTRNQGGIAVVPFSTLGQDLDAAALLNTMIWLGDLPMKNLSEGPKRFADGKLQGLTFETVFGDEDETIRMRAKAVCAGTQAYLAVAWINTNATIGPEVLEQWLNKISFSQEPATWPANAQAVNGFRERDCESMGLLSLGQRYYAKKDYDRSAALLRTAMECRFVPQILAAYSRAQYQRGHPEEIVSYLKSRGPLALKAGWVALELAFAESHCGDVGSAAAHYTQCLTSGGYTAGEFPPDCFEDYIRCLVKLDHANWARERLRQRMAVDPSPQWPKMLGELGQGSPAGLAVNSPRPTTAAATAAPAPTGPPHLKNIIWNPSMPSAQLDQNLVFEGDRVRGYKVVKIRQQSVELVTPEGNSLTLARQ